MAKALELMVYSLWLCLPSFLAIIVCRSIVEFTPDLNSIVSRIVVTGGVIQWICDFAGISYGVLLPRFRFPWSRNRYFPPRLVKRIGLHLDFSHLSWICRRIGELLFIDYPPEWSMRYNL